MEPAIFSMVVELELEWKGLQRSQLFVEDRELAGRPLVGLFRLRAPPEPGVSRANQRQALSTLRGTSQEGTITFSRNRGRSTAGILPSHRRVSSCTRLLSTRLSSPPGRIQSYSIQFQRPNSASRRR
jgi:hypothetical protein